jgi:hypothetical protein
MTLSDPNDSAARPDVGTLLVALAHINSIGEVLPMVLLTSCLAARMLPVSIFGAFQTPRRYLENRPTRVELVRA